MKNKITPLFLVQAALIAAIYAAVTLLFGFMSFGEVQVRVSEALTILPMFTPAAIPGLFIGCLISNLIGSASIFDIVFGSLATLLAAFLTRKLRGKIAFALMPPVLVNAVVVGLVLSLTLGNFPFWLAFLTVGAGQLVSCYGFGLALWWGMKRLPDSFKRRYFVE